MKNEILSGRKSVDKAQKQMNNRIQNKQNGFGEKYGNWKNITDRPNGIWIFFKLEKSDLAQVRNFQINIENE